MRRSHGIQVLAAFATMLMAAAASTTLASAGLVGGAIGGANGAVGGAVQGVGGTVGGAVNGSVNGTGPVTGTVNGALNGTINGNTNNGGTSLSGNANANGSAATSNASFAGSGNAGANASTSATLPNASNAMQAAYATMQKEEAAKQLVFAKAQQIRGTVTNTEQHYVSFIDQKGMTYVAHIEGAAKSGITKGSHVVASSLNYGQNVQISLDTSVAQSSSTSASSGNSSSSSNAGKPANPSNPNPSAMGSANQHH